MKWLGLSRDDSSKQVYDQGGLCNVFMKAMLFKQNKQLSVAFYSLLILLIHSDMVALAKRKHSRSTSTSTSKF